MSAVFLARDPVLSRLVAVKVLHPDLLYQREVLERFFKEAKTVSRINCANVVNVYDFGMEGKTPYLVMEFIDGQTLQKVMNQLQGEYMDPVVATAMIAQVVEGLGAASELGVVHRDLKPENLMLTQKGFLKVTDFGICHLKDHTMTVTGQILGSPRFMSPEQVKGVKPLTVQSDLFSVGAVFYYMLVGVAPFMAETIPELYHQIVNEPHRSLSEIKPGLDKSLVRLVDTLLEKDPAKRGAGPTAVAFQLKKILMKKKVIAPVERIRDYVKELNTAGLRTTSSIDPDQVRQWMGSLEIGKYPVHYKGYGKGILISAVVLILVLGSVASLVYFRPEPTSVKTVRTIAPSSETTLLPAADKPKLTLQPEETPQPKGLGAESERGGIPKNLLAADTNPILETSKSVTPEPPALNEPAQLTVLSVPPFAEVYLNGNLFGRTPLEGKSCPSGKYRLTLKSKFGSAVDTTLIIQPGPQSFKFVLMENPEDEGSK